MEIRYLEHSQIDMAAWDNCISKAVNGNLSAWSWFLNMMSSDWDALVEGEYETVFPMPFRKKAGIYYLYQPFFSQQLGIFSINPLTPEKIGQFLDAIPSKFSYANINLNSFNKPDPDKYKIINNLNHELDLIESYEIIRKSYKDNTRRNIVRANKEGVSISTNVKPEDIINLFKSNRGKDFSHLGEYDYRRLTRMIYHSLGMGKAICYGAFTSDNSFCAGAILLFSHRKVVFLFSGVNETARKNGAMSLLIDRFIQDLAGNHLTLDFEGSNDANLARFYSSFGASVLHYPTVIINRLLWPVKFLPSLRGKFRKIF
ncbi:MAG: GNAT family N-acetyltransferase [Lentimicrobium sp.]|nr:GNAT family N-acetyltransferase [Lentimicrobium sp.]